MKHVRIYLQHHFFVLFRIIKKLHTTLNILTLNITEYIQRPLRNAPSNALLQHIILPLIFAKR